MKIQSKALIKWAAVFCTIFQGFALYLGQPFNPFMYCSGIAALFGINSMHENCQQYFSQSTNSLPAESAE